MLSQVKQWICQRRETDTRIRTVRSSGWFNQFSLILILEIKLIKSSLIYLFISISGNIKSDPIPTHIVYSASSTSVIPVKPSSPLFNLNQSVPATKRFEMAANPYHRESPRKANKSCSNPKLSSPLAPHATNLVDQTDSSDFVYGSRVRYLQYVLHGAESNVWRRSSVNKVYNNESYYEMIICKFVLLAKNMGHCYQFGNMHSTIICDILICKNLIWIK